MKLNYRISTSLLILGAIILTGCTSNDFRTIKASNNDRIVIAPFELMITDAQNSKIIGRTPTSLQLTIRTPDNLEKTINLSPSDNPFYNPQIKNTFIGTLPVGRTQITHLSAGYLAFKSKISRAPDENYYFAFKNLYIDLKKDSEAVVIMPKIAININHNKDIPSTLKVVFKPDNAAQSLYAQHHVHTTFKNQNYTVVGDNVQAIGGLRKSTTMVVPMYR